MPAGDGTGPVGMGSGSGRGMGYCGGYDAPGWANWGPGRGFYGRGGRGIRGGYSAPPARVGRGRGGGGRGWRHWSHATELPRWARGPRSSGWDLPPERAYGLAYDAPYEPPSREQEVEMLKGEAAWLKEQLDAIDERMGEISQE